MIELRDVSCGYDADAVLSGISVKAEQGSLTCILGVNAAGKSTLLKTIAGVLRPMSGQVLVDGDDLAAIDSREAARRIAYIPQFTEPAFDLTVRDLVAVGRYSWITGMLESDSDHEAIEDAMQRAGCAPLAEREFATLSGGERQRCSLARGLAQGAGWMLMDEPLSHLDLQYRFAFVELLQRLKGDGIGLIVAVHELSPLVEQADHVWLLGRSELAWQGEPAELVGNAIIEDVLGVGVVLGPDGSLLPAPIISA